MKIYLMDVQTMFRLRGEHNPTIAAFRNRDDALKAAVQELNRQDLEDHKEFPEEATTYEFPWDKMEWYPPDEYDDHGRWCNEGETMIVIHELELN